MSLISHTQFDLVRLRKGMEAAFKQGDWVALRNQDRGMGAALDAAFTDSARSPEELITEMERILKVYASIVDNLPSSADEMLEGFPSSIG